MSLALRSSRALIGATRSHPYFRYASAARTAYRVAKRASPYVKMAYRSYRKRKRSNLRRKRMVRRRIGERVGSGGSKRGATNATNALATRTMYQIGLMSITRGTNVDNRLRDIVNFRGVKICMSFKSLTTDRRLFLNVAVVSGKSLSQNTIPPNAEFFRSSGGSTLGRGQDFSNTLTALQFHCLPINTDLYNIHSHKRIILEPGNSAIAKGAKTISWYEKFNRQIRYDDSTSGGAPTKQAWLVYWLDQENNGSGTTSVASVVDSQVHIVKYFREPKN